MKKEQTELDKIDVRSIRLMLYKDINKIPVLTKEEERKLIKESQEGNNEATKKLIVHNLKLVRDIAEHYKIKDGIDVLDLIEEGIFGLYKSIQNFNLNTNNKFSTYATPNIKSFITKFYEKNVEPTNITWYGSNKIISYRKFVNEYMRDNGKVPSTREIATALEISEKKVRELETLATKHISLDSYVDEDEEKTLKDNISSTNLGPEDTVVNSMINDSIKNIKDVVFNIKTLTEREKQILLYKCGFITGSEMTFEEIGQIYGVSRQRINQVYERAIKKILKSKEANDLAYLTRNPENSLKLIKKARSHE